MPTATGSKVKAEKPASPKLVPAPAPTAFWRNGHGSMIFSMIGIYIYISHYVVDILQLGLKVSFCLASGIKQLQEVFL